MSHSESPIRQLASESPLRSDQQLLCPPGFLYSTDTSNCECYPNSNIVCNEQQEAFIMIGIWSRMIYEEGEGSFLGLCILSFLTLSRNVRI